MMASTKSKQDIWDFQDTVSRRLLLWATANIVTGVWMQKHDDEFLNGIGSQSTSWGVINALIAIGGALAARARRNRPTSENPETLSKERRNLFRALWINGILDVFYMLGGIWLARTRGNDNKKLRGMGWGIVIQGAFLFIFDFIHAAHLADDEKSTS